VQNHTPPRLVAGVTHDDTMYTCLRANQMRREWRDQSTNEKSKLCPCPLDQDHRTLYLYFQGNQDALTETNQPDHPLVEDNLLGSSAWICGFSQAIRQSNAASDSTAMGFCMWLTSHPSVSLTITGCGPQDGRLISRCWSELKSNRWKMLWFRISPGKASV